MSVPLPPTPDGSRRPAPNGPHSSAEDAGGLNTPLGRAAVAMVAFIAVLWVIEGVEALDHHRLVLRYGIEPRDPGRLPEIFTAPFLHVNRQHVAGNSSALFAIGLVAALTGIRRLLAVTLCVIITSGLGVWLFAPANTVTVGASGIVFGYLGYLLLRGVVDRRPVDLVITVGVAIAYGSLLPQALPGGEFVSWQGHLAGFLGGLLAAWLFRRRRHRLAPAQPSAAPDPPIAGPDDPTRPA
jgi:Uncharacterized membrane protein (homolog of Drosophila rhomboid)